MASTKQVPAFKLSDLIKLFVARLSALGVHLEIRVHSTRFKKRLLSQFQEMSASNDKKEVFLVFNHDIGEAIATAAEANHDYDRYIFARAAHILRR